MCNNCAPPPLPAACLSLTPMLRFRWREIMIQFASQVLWISEACSACKNRDFWSMDLPKHAPQSTHLCYIFAVASHGCNLTLWSCSQWHGHCLAFESLLLAHSDRRFCSRYALSIKFSIRFSTGATLIGWGWMDFVCLVLNDSKYVYSCTVWLHLAWVNDA